MIPVLDGHNDALTRPDHDGLVSGRAGGHLDLPRMRAGGIRGAFFAVFTSSEEQEHSDRRLHRPGALRERKHALPLDHAVAAAGASAAAGRLFAIEREGHVAIARRIEDVDAARDRDGPPAAILHLEGAEAIDVELDGLELWYAAGLRSIGPVWSRSNGFGHGVPFVFPSSPDTGPGLTTAGRDLVRRCGELGILIDLSHLNEAGFWDVAALDAGPLVATHSGVHTLCAASRNLTDRQLDAIGASGGLVGIVFACPFLRADFKDEPDTPIELIAEHARYVANRIGAEHVALGSDFDGATIPAAVGDAAGMPRVLDALSRFGFTSGEIAAIAWDNWRRVLDAWWRS